MAVMVDRKTHAILKEECAKYELSMAAAIRLFTRRLKEGKASLI
jgi:hypothetical protein